MSDAIFPAVADVGIIGMMPDTWGGLGKCATM